jgi:hypothetical protein
MPSLCPIAVFLEQLLQTALLALRVMTLFVQELAMTLSTGLAETTLFMVALVTIALWVVQATT